METSAATPGAARTMVPIWPAGLPHAGAVVREDAAPADARGRDGYQDRKETAHERYLRGGRW